MPAAPRTTLFVLAALGGSWLSGCEGGTTQPTTTRPASSPLPAPAPNVTLYQDSVYELIGPAQQYATVVKMGQPAPPPRPGVTTLFQNEAISVLGDTALQGEFELYQRFTYRHAFADFPAAPGRGAHVRPDFKTNPQARWHITRITEGAKQPANFAGHYRLVTWGCGSSCQMSVLVDQHTGRIYDVPQTSSGLEYRLNSRLLITDHFAEEGDTSTYLVNSIYPAPAFYLWTGRQFQKLE
ncbi:hypothetical protein [Hymenobacter cellulosivorans]|uniref:Lipoprotein n=1 Tax=Hymenobacter cellulosivorans TaxID=2932249 RepID=A0ABY4F356_9BACT|nr:hypothetical protein [Hymenobacter cellulosivorans]UOQ50914.1 hypothetical protein MUN80_14220 [Hymenobacter cellulosivorans]